MWCLWDIFLRFGSLLGVFLLLSKSLKLIPRLLVHLGFLGSRRLQHGIQEFDLIFVQRPKLVPQPSGFFKSILLCGLAHT